MEKSEMKMFKYEKPVIVDLGEMARASTVDPCSPAGSQATGQCGNGNSAATVCSPSGTAAVGGCFPGTTAQSSCGGGSGF